MCELLCGTVCTQYTHTCSRERERDAAALSAKLIMEIALISFTLSPSTSSLLQSLLLLSVFHPICPSDHLLSPHFMRYSSTTQQTTSSKMTKATLVKQMVNKIIIRQNCTVQWSTAVEFNGSGENQARQELSEDFEGGQCNSMSCSSRFPSGCELLWCNFLLLFLPPLLSNPCLLPLCSPSPCTMFAFIYPFLSPSPSISSHLSHSASCWLRPPSLHPSISPYAGL